MGFIDLVAVKLSHGTVLVDCHFIKRYPCLQSGLVRHEFNEFQLAMGIAFQIRKKIGQGFI